MTAPTIWLSCGVLRDELLALQSQGLIAGDIRFLDSMLHMDPPRLEQTLSGLLEKTEQGACLVVVYGDCCSRMLDLVRQYRIGRVDAINCAQLLVGRDRYRQLMRQGAFLVLPEWALRWEQIMQTELGLTKAVARDLMSENRSELVYLDTGLVPVPEQCMTAFSDYSGLSWRVEPVTLDHLLIALNAAEYAAQQGVKSDKDCP